MSPSSLFSCSFRLPPLRPPLLLHRQSPCSLSLRPQISSILISVSLQTMSQPLSLWSAHSLLSTRLTPNKNTLYQRRHLDNLYKNAFYIITAGFLFDRFKCEYVTLYYCSSTSYYGTISVQENIEEYEKSPILL